LPARQRFTYEPWKFVTCGYPGTLGFGFPTALGVKAGNPDKAVVSITGDGGFQFGLQDLATAVQYGIHLVTVVFNNGAYGNVLRDLYGLLAYLQWEPLKILSLVFALGIPDAPGDWQILGALCVWNRECVLRVYCPGSGGALSMTRERVTLRKVTSSPPAPLKIAIRTLLR
jgi:hypothetical protein